MQHDLTPNYLSSLVPLSVSETSRYNLRNADDFTTITCRTQLYFSSFVPSAVREWNWLPEVAKQISCIDSNFSKTEIRLLCLNTSIMVKGSAYTSSHGLQFLKQRFAFEKYN